MSEGGSHRAIDGARLMQALERLIEAPMGMLALRAPALRHSDGWSAWP